jgi:hypothetical protein
VAAQRHGDARQDEAGDRAGDGGAEPPDEDVEAVGSRRLRGRDVGHDQGRDRAVRHAHARADDARDEHELPDLGLDEDLFARDAGVAQGLADLGLVAVGGGGVDVPVAEFERGLHGGDGLLGRGLEDAESEGGHLDAVVEGEGLHHRDLSSRETPEYPARPPPPRRTSGGRGPETGKWDGARSAATLGCAVFARRSSGGALFVRVEDFREV